jgi:hypothetical protein
MFGWYIERWLIAMRGKCGFCLAKPFGPVSALVIGFIYIFPPALAEGNRLGWAGVWISIAATVALVIRISFVWRNRVRDH